MRTDPLRLSTLSLSLLLAGCPGQEALDSGAEPLDRDGDTYAAPADCDDEDASVSPRAVERCDGVDDDCDGRVDEEAVDATLWYADADGDGYGAAATPIFACEQPEDASDTPGDCDDTDPDAWPDNDERCDGVDNDCDGTADESAALDALTWYADSDGDGHGNPRVSLVACQQPEGFVSDGADCDDADAGRSPSAPELCDAEGTDEDCDLLANDADDDAINPQWWYRDADGDTHGDPDELEMACEAPEGFVATSDDCDDADGGAYPGAAEVCGDRADDDCDGEADEDGVPVLWYTDADGDGYGDDRSAGARSCAGADGLTTVGGDCDDGDATVSPAAEETWYDGLDQDCDGGSDHDADGDGVAGLEGGGEDCDDTDAEVAPGLPERCGDAVDQDCDGESAPCSVLYTLSTYWEMDHLGAAITSPGDLDGDGIDDLAVGAPRDETADEAAGLVAVVIGDEAAEDSTTTRWRLSGEAPGDRAGSALASVDLDGDGLRDLVVGAPGASGGGDASGALYTLLESGRGLESLSVADGLWLGEAAGDRAAAALASAGEIDGDGLGDLLVGAPGAGGGAGAAYVVYGPVSAEADLTWAATTLLGEEASAAGAALAGDLDLDGDGLGDLLVGGPLASAGGVASGAAWLVLDPPTGAHDLGDATARWSGPAEDGRAGSALADAGDVDGDGVSDALVGAPEAGVGGVVWLLSGGVVASGALDEGIAAATLETSRAGAGLGTALAGLGDQDGDGFGDLALGAPGEDRAASDAGAAWLLLGPLSGVLDVEDAAFARIDGDVAGRRAGGALATLDRDGDGQADLAVGAPAGDDAPDIGGALWIWGLSGF